MVDLSVLVHFRVHMQAVLQKSPPEGKSSVDRYCLQLRYHYSQVMA